MQPPLQIQIYTLVNGWQANLRRSQILNSQYLSSWRSILLRLFWGLNPRCIRTLLPDVDHRLLHTPSSGWMFMHLSEDDECHKRLVSLITRTSYCPVLSAPRTLIIIRTGPLNFHHVSLAFQESQRLHKLAALTRYPVLSLASEKEPFTSSQCQTLTFLNFNYTK